MSQGEGTVGAEVLIQEKSEDPEEAGEESMRAECKERRSRRTP